VARLLFETVGLAPPPGVVPLKTGHLPTGKAVLAALAAHPVARAVRAHLERRVIVEGRRTIVL
jgi:hypothetical protein